MCCKYIVGHFKCLSSKALQMDSGLIISSIITLCYYCHSCAVDSAILCTVKTNKMQSHIYTILPKVLGHPILINRFDYFNHFQEYKS